MVSEFERLAHLSDEVVAGALVRMCDDEIIHVYPEEDDAVRRLPVVYAGIGRTRAKLLLVDQPRAEAHEPVAAALLHSVERARDEPYNTVAVGVELVAGWRSHVDVLARVELALSEVTEVDVHVEAGRDAEDAAKG